MSSYFTTYSSINYFLTITMVNYISNTTTKGGLKVSCRIDPREYVKGKKVSDEVMNSIALEPIGQFGKWNYVIRGFLSQT